MVPPPNAWVLLGSGRVSAVVGCVVDDALHSLLGQIDDPSSIRLFDIEVEQTLASSSTDAAMCGSPSRRLVTKKEWSFITALCRANCIALRFSSRGARPDPFVHAALLPFCGDIVHDVPLCPDHPLFPSLIQCLPSFLFDQQSSTGPHVTCGILRNFCAFANRDGAAPGRPVWSVELKPKSAWRPPTVVAASVAYGGTTDDPPGQQDNETRAGIVRLDPIKLMFCRFSLMQIFKHFARGRATARAEDEQRKMKSGSLDARSTYCPNMLLMNTRQTSSANRIGDALRRLALHHENNFRVMSTIKADEDHTTRLMIDVLEQALASTAGRAMLDEISSLQLYGSKLQRTAGDSNDERMVLDVSLLHHLDSCITSSSLVRLHRRCCQWNKQMGEACQCGLLHRVAGDVDEDHGPTPGTPASILPLGFCSTECAGDGIDFPVSDIGKEVSRFYTSVTARDLSLVISIRPTASGSPTTAGQETVHNDGFDEEEQCLPGLLLTVKIDHARCKIDEWIREVDSFDVLIGVVDIDCKRHKSIAHYAEQDAMICDAARMFCGSSDT